MNEIYIIYFINCFTLKSKLQNSCDITKVQKKKQKKIENNTSILLCTKTHIIKYT